MLPSRSLATLLTTGFQASPSVGDGTVVPVGDGSALRSGVIVLGRLEPCFATRR